MKVGDRVRYVGTTRPDWLGIPATVERVSGKGTFIEVCFDREWFNPNANARGFRGFGIPSSNLELLTMINPKRPVQTTETPPRQCRTIGLLERVEGTVTLLLAVPWLGEAERSPKEVEIDLNGKAVGLAGSSLGFRNAPMVESGFYPMETSGRPFDCGFTSLNMAKSEHAVTKFFLEIVRVDGVPTEAKIHAR